jgi:eukaryotic-like serine/threonine-protein kinase
MSAWTIPSYAEWAVPGYAEERQLGHGVSGRVVAAANERNGQPVAIKYFDASLVRDTEFLNEYRAEADRLRSLDAPHMVRLFDYVEQPGEGAAVVTGLVIGVSLREMITRRGALSPESALVVLKDSLLALVAAHSLRVPHRDLKPDNVLIDAVGWCTVTDFGIAVKPDKQMPAAGTPEYMAPELWDGAPSVPATDIYAAAAMLFESATGKPPFTGRPFHLREQHESAAVAVDRLDQPLPDLIGWGMAKDPADRPRSARSFLNEVDRRAGAAYGPNWEDTGRQGLAERAVELLPLLAGGGGGSALATRRARRKIIGFVSAAAVLLVVLVVGAAVVLSGRSDTAELSSSPAAAFSAQVTVTPPVAASPCRTATTFTYNGTVTATQPETLSYEWVYSSGKAGTVQTMEFTAAGHRAVSGGTVKATKAGSGWAEIKILSPAAKASNKATYKLLCGTANGDIALSALVSPSAETVSSCGATAPALTAVGEITTKKAGTVSYYWALGDGQVSAPGTLTFATPGTKSVSALTFTPPALPATGEAVLVVTKPDAATSSPAAYSVTCKVPVTTTPSPSAHATSSAKSSPTPAPGKSSPRPTTSTPTTKAPTTSAPTTSAPVTTPPVTTPPVTTPPVTTPPVTTPPVTTPPVTTPPVTTPPVTTPPVTTPPVTTPPVTTTPTTTAPVTSAPTT